MDETIPFLESPPEPTAPPAAVQTYNLAKTYRTGFWLNQIVTPLQGVDLTVQQGETFGLLGPNGAGKTTLLKMLLGITRPSQGRATVLGRPVGDRALKHRIGYLPENPYFYDSLTGWEFLQYTAGLFGIPAAVQRRRIPELLDQVQLPQSAARKKQLRKYSKGMLQRIGLAQALINDPDLVFLDEPMSGLDPMGRHMVREVILNLKAQGKTLFFNSHVLSDVEAICDRVAILHQGKMVCTGSLEDLLGRPNQYFARGRGGRLEILEKWLVDLTFERGFWQGYLQGDPYDFLSTVRGMGGSLDTLQLARHSLEDFFLARIREAEAPAEATRPQRQIP
ncbi:ABC transporter ATP-binding protein [Leptolyngbya sp. PCC 6406]|uniref:ABC transporter ATP-binding protein n=1 Tax=Leptolyngbya sp. PCC 6406 TaxID=1173264 RepID=UPI000315C178|nr:ABC transporter ATP-binding protein [Leptolyngbya sp. PCC 6406]